MELSIEVQKKPKTNLELNISGTKDVYNIPQVQAIKDAVQEHFLFIGLDNKNNVRDISLLGMGSGNCVNIDSKYIIRSAIVSASEKVILVHNHPSNSLKPSEADIHLSNVTGKMLKLFNVNLVDHIIVTENEYMSMQSANDIDRNYTDKDLEYIDKTLLLEENQRLKNELKTIKSSEIEDDMEM